MEYRVDELARLTGLSVDTVRFYQGRGLLPAPGRRGRLAIYGEVHLARLRRIRTWQDAGLTLAGIRRLLDRSGGEADEALIEAVAAERVGERTLTRSELAAESGVAEPLLAAAVAAGLLTPLQVGDEERFSEGDLGMAQAGLVILSAGFPLSDLLDLAAEHVASVQRVVDRAIELFDAHVRQPSDGADDEVREAFRKLTPQVTRLVALHFQRTLVNLALVRLEGREEFQALAQALAAVESAELEVKWK
jgi:DNA-binding transcriptional MerR regulator